MDDGALGADRGPFGPRAPQRLVLPAAAGAEYIAQLCAELETIARGTGETTLATLLKMARIEAARIAGPVPGAPV